MSIAIVNLWGGVPQCLHGHAARRVARWAHERLAGVPLDAFGDFESAFEGFFSRAKAEGYRTAVLGASARPSEPSERHKETFPDPRRARCGDGIDECSLFDGSNFGGDARAHDRHVLREAARLLDTPGKHLVVVNLLACRDVCEMGFHNEDDHLIDVATPRGYFDPRTIPRSVGLRVLQNAPLSARPCSWAGREYDCIRKKAVEYLDTCIDVCNEADSVIAKAAVRVVTSTRALSIGEYGYVGHDVPTHTCATTFFCASSAQRSLHGQSHSLRSLLHATCFGTLPHTYSTRVVCVGARVARLVTNVNNRAYACVFVNSVENEWTLRHVFDLDSDVHETEDVIQGVQHLNLAYDFATARTPSKSEAPRASRHQPVRRRAPDVLAVRRPPPVVVEDDVDEPPTPATVVPPDAHKRQRPRASLRRREEIVNLKHR